LVQDPKIYMPESVYISSTFKDLQKFRQAVINCIVSLGDFYKPVSMEFYDAEDVHFVQKCLSDVEACNVYILIVGKRYGYVPRGYTKSITEMEYEKARDCQRNGMVKEVLVFKVEELCDTYTYNETDATCIEYHAAFLDEINERLSPAAFSSEAELSFQVSHALMKRLFKRINTGEKIMPPDKDAIICYCNRNVQMTSIKQNILIHKKRIFFSQGNRRTDFPAGIIKRFAKYSLGASNKIEPLIKITDLFDSIDVESNQLNAFWNILDYLSISPTEENTSCTGFLQELCRIKSTKIILPFYYDFDFDEDAVKFSEFFEFAEQLFSAYSASKQPYELFMVIIIYSAQPDYNTIMQNLAGFPLIKSLSVFLEKFKPVTDNDIIDWLEKFITSIDLSATMYDEYFYDGSNDRYSMQDVNLKLRKLIDDMEQRDEKIKKYF
jgi:hypothetical protein